MFKKEIRAPILALFLLSLGGLLIHVKIHPTAVTPYNRNLLPSAFNWVPIVFGLAGAFVLPLLFNFRRTVAWAYLLNCAAVGVGVVTMAFFSVDFLVKNWAEVDAPPSSSCWTRRCRTSWCCWRNCRWAIRSFGTSARRRG